MNLAQKIAVAATLLVVAVLLVLIGHQDPTPIPGGEYVPIAFSLTDAVAVLLIGGALTLLLGIKRKRPKE